MLWVGQSHCYANFHEKYLYWMYDNRSITMSHDVCCTNPAFLSAKVNNTVASTGSVQPSSGVCPRMFLSLRLAPSWMKKHATTALALTPLSRVSWIWIEIWLNNVYIEQLTLLTFESFGVLSVILNSATLPRGSIPGNGKWPCRVKGEACFWVLSEYRQNYPP